MAHYAFLDQNNIVTDVIVGNDEDESGTDWEQYYGDFQGQICKRTSYNTRGGIHYDPNTNTPSPTQNKSFRKNYAGISFSYDYVRDAFIPPQPYPSWTLNEQTCLWDPPVPMPVSVNPYMWDEATLSWVEVG